MPNLLKTYRVRFDGTSKTVDVLAHHFTRAGFGEFGFYLDGELVAHYRYVTRVDIVPTPSSGPQPTIESLQCELAEERDRSLRLSARLGGLRATCIGLAEFASGAHFGTRKHTLAEVVDSLNRAVRDSRDV
jgi:hypothetical protein